MVQHGHWMQGLSAAALLGASAVLGVPAAHARINVGIGIGLPGFFAPPPVVVAPPPPPPPVVAYPAYGYYAPPAYYAPPVYRRGGHWWYDRWGHRHWRR